MSAQHKVHMLNATSGRSACRYSSRPSRRVKAMSLQAFADTPVVMRCVECEAKFRAFCGAIAKAQAGDGGTKP